MSDLFSQFEATQSPSRIVGWFSCGVDSAVACNLAAIEHPEMELVRIVLAGEHEDNERFHDDCEKWYGRKIARLAPAKYADHFEAAEGTRYINGPKGAACTRVLKIETRVSFQRPGDLHVFGFDADEDERANDFRDRFGLWMLTPLIEAGLRKPDCKAIVERAGIELPVMYRLGYANNNCVGCWKGKKGYWNRIRIDFPEVFARAAAVSRAIGRSPIKDANGKPVMLDDLDPTEGRWEEDQPPSCGPLCELAIDKLAV